MASGPAQAKAVFLYGSICSFCIMGVIVLTGLFVFIGSPSLPVAEVWSYILDKVPPVFQGFISVSLLAMAMSSADSDLNACSIMVSHDILASLRGEKAISHTYILRLARLTTLFVGLSGMLLTFYFKSLLDLFLLTFAFFVPIITAPFILAIFGFRGTSRTALIGMASAVLTILAWNKWVEPSTGIDGSFIAMLANGLAMLAAHYLFKQPEKAGWVKPDNAFKQMQQEKVRKREERKEAIRNAWTNRKVTLATLRPSHTMMVYMGFYVTITTLLAYSIVRITNHGCCFILQLFGAACCVGYPFLYDISKKVRAIPNWLISLYCLIGLALLLPYNLLWHWWHLVDPIFTLSLFLTHCVVILWLLPLYLGIGVVAAVSLAAIYPMVLFPALFPLFIASLLVFTIIICAKVKLAGCTSQILYLKDQEKIRKSRKLKASLYDSAMVPAIARAKGYGAILAQVIGKIEESISFLDGNMPLYKQDFQSIINKMYDWVAYFNSGEKAKYHALLQPTRITVDKLIRKVEFALSQEMSDPPRLLVEKINDPHGKPCSHIVCDINQVVHLLVQAVLRVGQLQGSCAPIVHIQLYKTTLKYKQADAIDSSDPVYILFQATALVISQLTASPGVLPKVKDLYEDSVDARGAKRKHGMPPSIDLQQETISTIVDAHYGYLETSVGDNQPTMLLVLPSDVSQILAKMTTALPLDSLTSETPVTPKEQADSMMALMQFHDYVCKASHREDPVDLGTISGLLLLLRQHFGFKRHASGQLFYVRAVGIAALVVEWVFHSPKVIYAALLYDLVRRTCLPLSYVKEHYNLGVYAFVLNVVGIDKHQALDHPSLLYVKNRLKKALREDHVQLSVLFIKLAERLYDLRHAAGYMHLEEVQHMAQETLTVDVKLANAYLGPEIGAALEHAANKALEHPIGKAKQHKDQGS